MKLYSGKYDIMMLLRVLATLGRLKNSPGHSGIRTSDLWNTSPNALPTELHGQDGSISDFGTESIVPSIPNTLNIYIILMMMLYSVKYDIMMLLRVLATLGRLKNSPGHSGIRTSDLWNTSPNALPTELHGQDGSITNHLSNRPDRVAQLVERWG